MERVPRLGGRQLRPRGRLAYTDEHLPEGEGRRRRRGPKGRRAPPQARRPPRRTPALRLPLGPKGDPAPREGMGVGQPSTPVVKGGAAPARLVARPGLVALYFRHVRFWNAVSFACPRHDGRQSTSWALCEA